MRFAEYMGEGCRSELSEAGRKMKRTLAVIIGLVMVTGTSGTADDLDQALGMDRRVGLTTMGPDLAPFSYGRPMGTIHVPEQLVFPLQAANEALTFYAAYRARNYRAMAAVGAMSLCGGTLRKGIDAVTSGDSELKVEDLADLSPDEIAVLSYLWHTEGRTGQELYLAVVDHGTWEDVSGLLKKMEKDHLIRKTRSGSRDVYRAVATPGDTRRAVLASASPDQITSVLRAIQASESRIQPEAIVEQRSTGDSAEAD